MVTILLGNYILNFYFPQLNRHQITVSVLYAVRGPREYPQFTQHPNGKPQYDTAHITYIIIMWGEYTWKNRKPLRGHYCRNTLCVDSIPSSGL